MRRSRYLGSLALVVLLAVAPGRAFAAPEELENTLNVAAILVRDGHFDRAAKVLAEIVPTAKGLDKKRFYTLAGMVALRRDHPALAARHLERALAAGQKKKSALLMLAQAHFRARKWRAALLALARAGRSLDHLPAVFALKARAQLALGDKGAAWKTLRLALQRHPKDLDLARRQVLLLLDLGLFQAALRSSRRFISRPELKATGVVAMAEALRRAGQHKEAIVALELARLRFGESAKLLQLLGRSYFDAGMVLAAADLMQRAALLRPKLAADAAELYRRASRPMTALHLNAQVPDQRIKLRQRIAILVDLGRYERIAALVPRLSRLGLLEDQALCYALAYAFFRTGRYAASERWLKQISRPSLYRKAMRLRRHMASCEQGGGAECA